MIETPISTPPVLATEDNVGLEVPVAPKAVMKLTAPPNGPILNCVVPLESKSNVPAALDHIPVSGSPTNPYEAVLAWPLSTLITPPFPPVIVIFPVTLSIVTGDASIKFPVLSAYLAILVAAGTGPVNATFPATAANE